MPAWMARKRRGESWRATPCADPARDGDVARTLDRVFEAMGHGALDAVDMPMLTSSCTAGQRRAAAEEDRRRYPASSATGTASRKVDRPEDPCAARDPLRSAGRDRGVGGRPRGAGESSSRSCRKIFPPRSSSFSTSTSSSPPAWRSGCQSDRAARAGGEGRRPPDGGRRAPGRHQRSSGAERRRPSRLHAESRSTTCTGRRSTCFSRASAGMWRGEAVGVLLTGMGKDGALGLRRCAIGATTPSRRTKRRARCTACRKPPPRWTPPSTSCRC